MPVDGGGLGASAPGPRTFGKERRVRKRQEFQLIQREGRRVPTPHFVLVFRRQNPPQTLSRVGFTVPRKAGNAVARNRLKRLLREAIRTNPDLLPPGYDVVVIVPGPFTGAGLAEVREELSLARLRFAQGGRGASRGRPT